MLRSQTFFWLSGVSAPKSTRFCLTYVCLIKNSAPELAGSHTRPHPCPGAGIFGRPSGYAAACFQAGFVLPGEAPPPAADHHVCFVRGSGASWATLGWRKQRALLGHRHCGHSLCADGGDFVLSALGYPIFQNCRSGFIIWYLWQGGTYPEFVP